MKEQVEKLMKEWLDSGKVDSFLALREVKGNVMPHLFHKGDEISIVLSPRYALAKIVMKLQDKYPDEKIGVVARGGDARGIVAQNVREGRINTDNIFIIGIADKNADDAVTDIPFPEKVEIIIGDQVEIDKSVAITAKAEEIRKMPLKERFEFFEYQFQKCIKCYGCRNVCPHCFCPECRLEDSKWVETGSVPPNFPMFHMIMAIHGIGRCVGCRECEAACPMDIPLTALYSLMREEVNNEFDYISGLVPDAEMPIVTTFEVHSLKGGE